MSKPNIYNSFLELHAQLVYFPITGEIKWKIAKKYTSAVAGNSALIKSNWYNKDVYTIMIDGVCHKAEDIAWILCYGFLPAYGITFIDGDQLNIKFSNLREKTYEEWFREDVLRYQKRYLLEAKRRGGNMGVSYDKCHGLWRAHITIYKKKLRLGYYKNMSIARLARLAVGIESGLYLEGDLAKIVNCAIELGFITKSRDGIDFDNAVELSVDAGNVFINFNWREGIEDALAILGERRAT